MGETMATHCLRSVLSFFAICALTLLAAISSAVSVTAIVPSAAEAWGGTDQPYCEVYLDSGMHAGVSVALSSSDPSALSVPSQIDIPGISTNAYFYVTTVAVNSERDVTITATLNGVAQCTIKVKPNRIQNFVISQSEVWGGTETPYVEVYLDAPARPEGYTVDLTSSDPSACSIPDPLFVSGTSSSSYVYLVTHTVSSPKNVTITATLNGGSKSVNLLVKPNRVRTMTISQPSCWGGSENPYVELWLDHAAPASGYEVTLWSSDPAVVSVPPSKFFPAGTEAEYFYVETAGHKPPKVVQIYAMLNGGEEFVQLFVQPVRVATFDYSQNPIIGGTQGYATLGLTFAAPPDGATATLTSSNPDIVMIPPTLNFGANTTSNYFYYETVPVDRVHYVHLGSHLHFHGYVTTLAVLPAYHHISGRLRFGDLVGPLPTNVTFSLRDPDTHDELDSQTVPIGEDGSYTLEAPASEIYEVSVKHTHWLRKNLLADATGGQSVQYLDFELLNGDIDQDNAVTLLDYDIFSAYFDRSNGDGDWTTVGENGFAPRDADLDEDGGVTLLDYDIFSRNFDMAGDS